MLDRNPFGKLAFEYERQDFGDRYSDFFFRNAPFFSEAAREESYLFIGRRGSGKTTLANCFPLHPNLKDCFLVDVDEPKVYADIVNRVSELHSRGTLNTGHIVDLWEIAIWTLIFDKYRDFDPIVKRAALAIDDENGATFLLKRIFQALIGKFIGDADITDKIHELFADPLYKEAKELVKSFAASKPIVIAIDSQERYDIYNSDLMYVTAALIEMAAKFNSKHSRYGIHIKVFIAAEVFPYLREKYISNSLKYIRDEIYLHWRPKDLTRFVSWRLFKYLQENKPKIAREFHDVDWSSYEETRDRIWKKFFGWNMQNDIVNVSENTLTFVVRHTQLRPRQVIAVLNGIAKAARGKGFPHMASRLDIVKSETYGREKSLAEEVINSYSETYPGVSEILDVLNGVPMIFQGNLLDKLAHRSAHAWPKGSFSKARFRQLVAELGIIGRIRQESDKFVEADFEYNIDGRLTLSEESSCVVHPMFGRKLNVEVNRKVVVFPFPNHPDFNLDE